MVQQASNHLIYNWGTQKKKKKKKTDGSGNALMVVQASNHLIYDWGTQKEEEEEEEEDRWVWKRSDVAAGL